MSDIECPGPHVPISSSVPVTELERISKQLSDIQKSLDNVLSHLSDLLDEDPDEVDEPVGTPSSTFSSFQGPAHVSPAPGSYAYRSFPLKRSAADFGPHPSFGPMAYPKRNPYFK